MPTATRTRFSVRSGSITVELYACDCPQCGVIFALPNDLDDRRREDHRSFYCPNGHSMNYSGPTKAEKERKRADDLARQLANRDARIERLVEDRDHQERVARALRGHLTRLKNRIANGVCPVPGCKRSGFADVRRHIHSKRPDWAHDHPEALDVG